jgi:hypothetical protein
MHVWNHFVLDIETPDGGAAFLSLYAIAYSPSIGSANVGLLRLDSNGVRRDLLLSDDGAAACRMRDRLRALGYGRTSLDVEPSNAVFNQTVTVDRITWRIEWGQSTAVATWSMLQPAFQVWAPAPQLVDDEDISAVFIEAAQGRLEIDARLVEGAVAMDDAWVPKVGRALLASHCAIAEVRVHPA